MSPAAQPIALGSRSFHADMRPLWNVLGVPFCTVGVVAPPGTHRLRRVSQTPWVQVFAGPHDRGVGRVLLCSSYFQLKTLAGGGETANQVWELPVTSTTCSRLPTVVPLHS